jgi:hypothetical protein
MNELNQLVDNFIAREDDRTEPITFLKEAARMTSTTKEDISEHAYHVSPCAEAQQRFEQEEQAYWQQRDELLKEYAGRWVAIVGGQVAAVGEQMNKVAAEAWRKTGSGLMYVNLVGGEDVALRVRQVVSGHYDRAYAPPMPMIAASVSDKDDRIELSAFLKEVAQMTLTTTEEIYEQIVKPLPAAERLRLVEKIVHDLSIQAMLDGEDAQAWVSRTRRESDEDRERQWRRE